MQPLISPVDHESRHNTYQVEDERIPAEDTPLLQRFPQNDITAERHTFTTAIVSLLLLMLISGVVIGIYLLVIQSNSENILPPIEMPLQLVSRMQWDTSDRLPSLVTLSPMKTSQMIVVQTDTEQCYSLHMCALLLNEMKMKLNRTSSGNSLPYNFLVSSNGQTFEALGWRRPSPLFPEYSQSALVLAFIGNFTEVPPTPTQLDEAKNFFAESVSFQHLETAYVIIGKSTKYVPKYLFQSLSILPQWDNKLSDM